MANGNPFDYVKSVNNKDHIDDLDGYNPYLTNHALMPFVETIFYANEMNQYSFLEKKMQYDFYYHGIPPRNRFEKWLKKHNSEHLELVCKYFNYSVEKGKAALQILTEEQIEEIKKKMDVGGK